MRGKKQILFVVDALTLQTELVNMGQNGVRLAKHDDETGSGTLSSICILDICVEWGIQCHVF